VSSSPFGNDGGIAIDALTDNTIDNYGYISGTYIGILINKNGLLQNVGTITSSDIGIDISGDSTVINKGLINSATLGVVLNGSTLLNSGFISSNSIDGFALYAGTGDHIINTGTIFGSDAIRANASVYILNAGVINGNEFYNNEDAIFTTAGITLAVEPSASFEGYVIDSSGQSTLCLGGTTSGSLDISGFFGFPTIIFDPGAEWCLTADDTQVFNGQHIEGMSTGDTLNILGFFSNSATYTSNHELILENASAAVTIDVSGNLETGDFVVSSTRDGTSISAPCFLIGTQIMTSRGPLAIEFLNVGDLVRVKGGHFRPIRWIGYRSYMRLESFRNRRLLPIVICEGALGNGIPSRDLYLSPDHSIVLDDCLIMAKDLINNVSIIQLTDIDIIEYFHIELDSHDIIFAENCLVESFLDDNCRERFENSYQSSAIKLSIMALPCLPRLDCGFHLNDIRLKINRLAGINPTPEPSGRLRGFIDEISTQKIRGWAQFEMAPDSPVILFIVQNDQVLTHILANKFREDLMIAGLGTGYHGFEFYPADYFDADGISIFGLVGGRFQALTRSYFCNAY